MCRIRLAFTPTISWPRMSRTFPYYSAVNNCLNCPQSARLWYIVLNSE
jgi:hypothetical protein